MKNLRKNKVGKWNWKKGEWQEYKLSELGDVYSGLQGKSKGDFGEGKRYISYMNVYSNPRINLNIKEFVSVKEGESQNVVRYGDIFFTTSSETPDEVAISSVLLDRDCKDIYLNSFCFGYRLNNFDILSPEFSQFYFRSSIFRKRMKRIAQGAIRYNLSKRYFLEEKITLPDVEEQKGIVSVMEKWDKCIELLDQKVQIKKNIKKYLQQILLTSKVRLSGFEMEWKQSKIKELGKVVTGSTPATRHKEYYDKDNGYPWVTPSDINSELYISKTERYLTEEGLTKGRTLPAGSLLITCIASIGKNIILHSIGSCNQQINAVLPSPLYDTLFLYYYLTYFDWRLRAYAGTGAMQILNQKDFGNFKITIPPLEEQKAISSVFSKLDEEIAMLEKQRDIIEEQKKYLLNNFVTGEIRLPKFRNNK